MKKYTILLGGWIASTAQAVSEASGIKAAAMPMPGSNLSNMVLSLLGIILLMLGVYWGARRFLMQRLGIRRVESMRIISVTMLGPKEKVVMLDTREGEVLILGVTPQNITLLDKRRFEQEE